MPLILKQNIATISTLRSRHILHGQQYIPPLKSSSAETEEIQKRIIALDKITRQSVFHNQEVLWSSTSDYMKTNKANNELRKVLTACGVILAIDIFLFIQAGKDLKRRRMNNMQEREIQRTELNLLGSDRHKIGRPFVVN